MAEFYHALLRGNRRARKAFLGSVAAFVVFWAAHGNGLAKVRIEFDFCLSANRPSLGGTYVHRFEPPFSYPHVTSSAGQTLTFKATPGVRWGSAFGINLLLSDHAGIQVLAWGFEKALDIESSAVDILLEYEARYPPDYIPRDVRIQASYPWPDAESGRTRNLILALNGLVRVGHRKPFALDLSAGLAYTRWEGDMKTLFYAKYWLGGHSVLMSYTYKLKMICGPEGKIGFNAGIACDVAIARGVCLMIEGRYAFFSSGTPVIRFELIPGTGYITPEDESAVRNLVPNFLPIDPSSFRFAAGFKISL